jgi:hypothetical protein
LPVNGTQRLACGDNDAALDRTVDYLVRWAAAPNADAEPAPRVPEVRSS